MTKKTTLNAKYAAWIETLSVRYRQSQIKAAVAVNAEMLKFYFSLGRDIVLMEADQPWGSGFLKRVSLDLKTKMPEAGCFSVNNLVYMRCFFRLYAPAIFTPQVGGKMKNKESFPQIEAITPQLGDSIVHRPDEDLDSPVFHIPWGHHKLLIDKFRGEPD